MAARIRRHRAVPDIWPGFVDAISTLLIIILFLLMVFTLAQYFLSEALSGRNEALARLNRQVAELADMLALEKRTSAELRRDLAQMSAELQSSSAARDALNAQVADLTARVETAEAEKQKAAIALDEARKLSETDRETIRTQLATVESLRRDIAQLQKVRDELEKKIAGMAAALDDRTRELTAARDRSKRFAAELSSEKERTALAQKDIAEKDVRLSRLGEKLEESDRETAAAKAQVDLLNRQIAALRQQLARIATALEASEARAKEQQIQIVNLGNRLNAALASKVEELARYRSEFFGKLREALGGREDIRIVGDRFVFQSEVLFPSGSADLSGGGRGQIERVAGVLKEISGRIPKDVDWVLQVDGHTDQRPIHTAQFPSNWELSTARAISVVKLLLDLGLPPDRLAAAGYGEYRPIDTSNDEIGWRRNRRIEFKLTNR
jgi:chemotaxis protein MotB